jgi:hypothetical protein
MESLYKYSFVTTWKIKASLHDVWQLIYDHKEWPNWWKAVLKAETLQERDKKDIGKMVSYSWRSILPYTLNFKMISTIVEEPFVLEGIASGDLEGEGKWILDESEGITTAKCIWNVNTNKKWMNKMTNILRPLFIWNHKIAMKWGAKGMAKKLDAELISY